jgi:dCMP deaminase
MDTRPSKIQTFLNMALVLSEQSTCVRRKVGAIFTDHLHHIISAGYNGGAPGLTHCTESPCKGANMPSGEGLDLCEATHAEQNALMWCHDVQKIHSVYVTTAPCVHCIKMLMNTSCEHIHFVFSYPHSDTSRKLWLNSSINRTWNRHALKEVINNESN